MKPMLCVKDKISVLVMLPRLELGVLIYRGIGRICEVMVWSWIVMEPFWYIESDGKASGNNITINMDLVLEHKGLTPSCSAPTIRHVRFSLTAVRPKMASLSDSSICVPYHKSSPWTIFACNTWGYGTTAVVIVSLGDIVRIGFHLRTCLEAMIVGLYELPGKVYNLVGFDARRVQRMNCLANLNQLLK